MTTTYDHNHVLTKQKIHHSFVYHDNSYKELITAFTCDMIQEEALVWLTWWNSQFVIILIHIAINVI